jgi:signal transduction histidine kinase/ActR/RegA family two-component response regulator
MKPKLRNAPTRLAKPVRWRAWLEVELELEPERAPAGGAGVAGVDVAGVDVAGAGVAGVDVAGVDVAGVDVAGADVASAAAAPCSDGSCTIACVGVFCAASAVGPAFTGITRVDIASAGIASAETATTVDSSEIIAIAIARSRAGIVLLRTVFACHTTHESFGLRLRRIRTGRTASNLRGDTGTWPRHWTIDNDLPQYLHAAGVARRAVAERRSAQRCWTAPRKRRSRLNDAFKSARNLFQRPWLQVALVITYFLAGKLGLSFAAVNDSASAIWPPTGIALGALLLFGHRVWPAIFIGAFLVNVTTSGSVVTSLGIAGGNTLEGLLGARLVERYAGGTRCFDRARDVFKFAALAGLLSTIVSATIGVCTLSLAGYAPWSQFGSIWITWWLGDAVGALIVGPLVVLSYTKPAIAAGQRSEALVMAVLIAAVGALIFAAPVLRDYPLAFLCLPPLAWVAFRFGPREVAAALTLLTIVATFATEQGLGAFVMPTRNESLLLLQAFMGTIALTVLPMAALVREHKSAVAEREQAEAVERNARAEAETANRAKDEFIAMLSHELRNPLQAIASSVYLLRQPQRGADFTERAVDIIARQTDHLTRLVNDLLDVARAITGKIMVIRQPVRLDDLIKHCVELLANAGRLQKHSIDVRTEPLWIHADPARIDQVIGNLLTNAIKYTPAGGSIRLTARHEGGHAVVRVADSGIGIAPELLPRVFDLFIQGQRGLDRAEGGLGIGLTLVRRLVQLHGGEVSAHSAGLERGSEFVVRLPACAPPAAAAARDSAAAAAALLPRRVLIVEDNADARRALRQQLEVGGHQVYEAEDGPIGIDAALQLRPDVVLVDIGLPHSNGYEVARTLRINERPDAPRMRLVAVTGYGRIDDMRRSREAGFDDHLVKPIGPEDLQRALYGSARSIEATLAARLQRAAPTVNRPL